ncbi:exported hypothetical protein [Candidatus Zixiibacteriota bacterium]|nr:exported hypothetical protein [candidate division Zixibacteria bacterium]
MFSGRNSFKLLLILTLCIALTMLACSKGGSGVDNDDEPAPPAVDDLEITEVTATTVTLAWTAPGDSGQPGNADAYSVRYAEFMITEQNWGTATSAANPPGPNFPGLPQSMLVTGLTPGTLYCFALKAKSPSDKWSPLSNLDSATTNQNLVVNFPDAALRAGIRAAIGKPTGDIYNSDLLSITQFSDTGAGISDLTGLEACIALNSLNLRHNNITGIAPLADLNHLQSLTLYDNQIADLSPLQNLHGIRRIYLTGNAITDLTPLAGLTNLEELELGSNNITNIGPLSGLTDLHFLFLFDNNISDISAVSGLNKLFNLILSDNDIADITPLGSLDSLVQLSLASNNISTITALSTMTGLNIVNLQWNQITDLAPLVNNSGIGSGDNVYLEFNPLSDNAKTVQIPALETKGATVHYTP